MRLLVALEHHFLEYGGGIYTETAFAYDFWQEYLEVFDEILVVARVRHMDACNPQWHMSSGPKVSFFPVREYRGLLPLLRVWPVVLRQCRQALQRADAYLLRLPGNIGTFVWIWLKLQRSPYAVDVVGDPMKSIRLVGSFRRIGLGDPLARLSAWILEIQVRGAACVSYNSRYLQRLYPPSNARTVWLYSGVRLTPELFTGPRLVSEPVETRTFYLVTVANLVPYKGHEVLLEACSHLNDMGMKRWHLFLAGSGSERKRLERIVAAKGLSDQISFLGTVTWGTDLFRLLDQSDLFVLPSFQEGLPRALLEAMARGLPAVATAVGGVPEILAPEDIVPCGDPKALAEKIVEVMRDPERLRQMSERNFAKAQEYRLEVMKEKKLAFWRCIRETSSPKIFGERGRG
jgi:glycosyltransferase involved in cell wall biosynthesis